MNQDSLQPPPPGDSPEEVQARMFEALMRFQAEQFSSAKAFLNVVMIAGYAGFFAIWSFTKDFLTERESISAALMLTFSATLFVSFETFQMFFLTRTTHGFARSLQGSTPLEIIAKLQKFGQTQKIRAAVLASSWTIIVPIIYVTALIGVCILGYAFVERLIDG